MRKDSVKIAIIDNGVFENNLEITNELISYDVTADGKIKDRISQVP